MNKLLGFGALMTALLLVIADDARGQRPAGNVVKATPEDYKALAKSTQISGIIVSADARSLTFRIGVPGAYLGKKGGKLVPSYKEFDLDVSDNVVIKKMFLNADYDDKGNFIVDEKAKKELKAKGYITSKIQDVKSGTLARLTLSPPKKGDEVAGVGNIAKPLVKTIVLDKEGAPVEPAKTVEKKKKN